MLHRCRRCQDSNPRECKPEYCSCQCHKGGAPYGPRFALKDRPVLAFCVALLAVATWWAVFSLLGEMP